MEWVNKYVHIILKPYMYLVWLGLRFGLVGFRFGLVGPVWFGYGWGLVGFVCVQLGCV